MKELLEELIEEVNEEKFPSYDYERGIKLNYISRIKSPKIIADILRNSSVKITRYIGESFVALKQIDEKTRNVSIAYIAGINHEGRLCIWRVIKGKTPEGVVITPFTKEMYIYSKDETDNILEYDYLSDFMFKSYNIIVYNDTKTAMTLYDKRKEMPLSPEDTLEFCQEINAGRKRL